MTRIIILAAGRGTRMNSELPKVVVSLKNKPMITYLLDAILASGVDSRPIIVVSFDNKKIISQILKKYKLEYVVQKKQLGTGNAVACAIKTLKKNVDKVLVLYGDHPFFKSSSLQEIIKHSSQALTMLTTKLPDFNDWRRNFYHWGRIVRDDQNNIEKIVEFKDADEKEKLITEVNPALMYFNRQWLSQSLAWLDNNNSQKEYYLTDLVKIAFNQGLNIETMELSPTEAVGINSLEELETAENLL